MQIARALGVATNGLYSTQKRANDEYTHIKSVCSLLATQRSDLQVQLIS